MIVTEFLSWRRRRAARLIPLSEASLDGLTPPAPDHGGGCVDRDVLLRLIATLPPRQRAVVALRFYEDLSHDQIAEILGCRPVTVRTHLSRALATLRGALPTSPAFAEESL
jgi:RNA polymerase sigma factor (sigma-70 family)